MRNDKATESGNQIVSEEDKRYFEVICKCALGSDRSIGYMGNITGTQDLSSAVSIYQGGEEDRLIELTRDGFSKLKTLLIFKWTISRWGICSFLENCVRFWYQLISELQQQSGKQISC